MKPMRLKLLRGSRRLFLVLTAVFLVLSASAYCLNILTHHDAEKTYWQAFASTMQLSGVTCTVRKEEGGQKSTQRISLDLASGSRAKTISTLNAGSSTVTTEDITTDKADYIRYRAINANKNGKPIDASNIIDIWAKQERDKSGVLSLYETTVTGGCALPLANLDDAKQQRLLTILKKGAVYQTDFEKSVWHWRFDEPVRTYTVTVDPIAFVTFMKQVTDATGSKALDDVSIASFRDKKPEKFIFTIGVNTTHIKEIHYQDNKASFKFSAFDSRPDTTVPNKTVSALQLQQRLQELK